MTMTNLRVQNCDVGAVLQACDVLNLVGRICSLLSHSAACLALLPVSVYESQRRYAVLADTYHTLTTWSGALQAELCLIFLYVSHVLCQLVRYNWTSWIVIQQPLICRDQPCAVEQDMGSWVRCNSLGKFSSDKSFDLRQRTKNKLHLAWF